MSNYQDPEVLGWVNTIREKDGRKPLKRISYARREEGERHIVYPTNCNCPIAVSIVDYAVTKDQFRHKDEQYFHYKPLPDPVRNWIAIFDEEQEEELCLS